MNYLIERRRARIRAIYAARFAAGLTFVLAGLAAIFLALHLIR